MISSKIGESFERSVAASRRWCTLIVAEDCLFINVKAERVLKTAVTLQVLVREREGKVGLVIVIVVAPTGRHHVPRTKTKFSISGKDSRFVMQHGASLLDPKDHQHWQWSTYAIRAQVCAGL